MKNCLEILGRSPVIGDLRKRNRSLIVSYKRLRLLIGSLGMGLPFLCYLIAKLFEGKGLQLSLSLYYYTYARDLFVGVLVCVGLFLVSYKGYEVVDNIVTTASGIFALAVAAFPCLPPPDKIAPLGIFGLPPGLSDTFHLVSAAIFFVLLAFNSLCLFTLTDESREMTERKKWRNRIYRFCGGMTLAVLVAMPFVLAPSLREGVERWKLIFWLEAAMLVFFGFAWFVKSGIIMADRPEEDGMRAA